MVELEDHLTESLQKDKTNKKKSSGNSKAMNNLKQKLRKLAKQFDESITAYRKVNDLISYYDWLLLMII
jgi:translation initiation factor 3 subunit C